MKKIIVLFAVLLHASPFVLAQIGSITPARPSAGSPIVLRYDAANKDAALHASGEVFATMQITAPSGNINRTIKLVPGERGTLEGTTELPENAA